MTPAGADSSCPPALFRAERRAEFDFRGAPGSPVLRRSGRKPVPFSLPERLRWSLGQRLFLSWARRRSVFTEEYVRAGKEAFDAFYAARGPLRGSVLDIGGGWGLHRQWWEPAPGDVFVVHDPGVERFRRGPHEVHRRHYADGLARPLVFVEGFGEDLPYVEGAFDACLVAAALDHCVRPELVLRGAQRCLRAGGALLVVQECASPEGAGERSPAPPPRLRARVKKLLKAALRLDHHLHRFSAEGLERLLEEAGFASIRGRRLPGSEAVLAFEARKPGP